MKLSDIPVEVFYIILQFTMDKHNFVTGLLIKKSITNFILSNGHYYELLQKSYLMNIFKSNMYTLNTQRSVLSNDGTINEKYEHEEIHDGNNINVIYTASLYKFVVYDIYHNQSYIFLIEYNKKYMKYRLKYICNQKSKWKHVKDNNYYFNFIETKTDKCVVVDITRSEHDSIKTLVIRGFNTIKNHIVKYRGTTIEHIEKLFKRDIYDKI